MQHSHRTFARATGVGLELVSPVKGSTGSVMWSRAVMERLQAGDDDVSPGAEGAVAGSGGGPSSGQAGAREYRPSPLLQQLCSADILRSLYEHSIGSSSRDIAGASADALRVAAVSPCVLALLRFSRAQLEFYRTRLREPSQDTRVEEPDMQAARQLLLFVPPLRALLLRSLEQSSRLCSSESDIGSRGWPRSNQEHCRVPLGVHRLCAVRWLRALVEVSCTLRARTLLPRVEMVSIYLRHHLPYPQMDWAPAHQTLCSSGVIPVLLDLCVAHPHHSLLHVEVCAIVETIMKLYARGWSFVTVPLTRLWKTSLIRIFDCALSHLLLPGANRAECQCCPQGDCGPFCATSESSDALLQNLIVEGRLVYQLLESHGRAQQYAATAPVLPRPKPRHRVLPNFGQCAGNPIINFLPCLLILANADFDDYYL